MTTNDSNAIKLAEEKLTHIVTGATGSLAKGISHVLYGLDDNGKVWALNPTDNAWERVHNPVDGELKNGPDDPGDDIPSWRGL